MAQDSGHAEMSERAAEAIADLLVSDAKLRGMIPTDPLVVEPDRTPWPPLRPGEKVRLELDVTVGHPLGDDTMVFYVAHGDKTVSLYLPVDHPQVRVTRAEPVDGVPQVGELWADDTGRTHFVADFDEDGPLLIDADGMSKGWRGVHTGKHGPIRRLMTADEIASYAGYFPRYIVGAS